MGKTTGPDSLELAHTLGTIYDLRQCPYEFSHVVKSIKFQSHITRCRAHFPEKAKTLQICAYNQSHHIPEGKENMDEHLKSCFDFHRLINKEYVYNKENVMKLISWNND